MGCIVEGSDLHIVSFCLRVTLHGLTFLSPWSRVFLENQ